MFENIEIKKEELDEIIDTIKPSKILKMLSSQNGITPTTTEEIEVAVNKLITGITNVDEFSIDFHNIGLEEKTEEKMVAAISEKIIKPVFILINAAVLLKEEDMEGGG